MTFMPGKSGNPHGRPKRIDPLSQRLQAFYSKHQADIDKVVTFMAEAASIQWDYKNIVKRKGQLLRLFEKQTGSDITH